MSRASRHSATPNACPRPTRRRSWEERCRTSTNGSDAQEGDRITCPLCAGMAQLWLLDGHAWLAHDRVINGAPDGVRPTNDALVRSGLGEIMSTITATTVAYGIVFGTTESSGGITRH